VHNSLVTLTSENLALRGSAVRALSRAILSHDDHFMSLHIKAIHIIIVLVVCADRHQELLAISEPERQTLLYISQIKRKNGSVDRIPYR
jgi:hypothetical protein